MSTATVVRAPDQDAVASLHAIDTEVLRSTGHEAVPEAVWRAISHRTADCVLATSADGRVVALSMPSDSFSPAFRQLAVAARPDEPPDTIATTVAALRTADDAATLTAWLPGTIAVIERALTGLGFVVDRRQFQMRAPLPRPDALRIPPGVEVRAFRPGTDDAAWLRVNNRAFANHPDQGGWVEEILARRMAEPWFDPAGFLLGWRGAALVGFCWTKVHQEPEVLGEIFVIGVDPDAQGTGLGRAMTLAGLDHLANVRHCPVGVLYVSASNDPAVALYRSIGFDVARTDTALVQARS